MTRIGVNEYDVCKKCGGGCSYVFGCPTWEKAMRESYTVKYLKPCPRCGNEEILANVYRGDENFGCGEYKFEAVCKCGISFNCGPYETSDEAMEHGTHEWNIRINDREG